MEFQSPNNPIDNFTNYGTSKYHHWFRCPCIYKIRLQFKLILIFLFIFIRSVTPSQATPFTGKVISVADGDTITVLTQQNKQVKVRLSGVDCPEGGQAYGKKAKQFTASMVYKKIVTIEPETTDRYGRTVAMVLINGSNLSELIIANGYGWVYRKYCTWGFCDDWLNLENQVRERRLGLWADKHPIAPWEWRSQQREGNNSSGRVGAGGSVNKFASVGGSAGSGTYHGNIKSHVFHSYRCQHYNCKNCTVKFRSIQEAVGAGYRKHEQCVKE